MMDFLDSLEEVKVEDVPTKESIIIWADDPKQAIKVRDACRREGHDCTIRYAGAFVGIDPQDTRRENDVEACTMCIFLGASRRSDIINAYRQSGYRNVTFKDVAVGSFGEPEAVPSLEREPEVDAALDPADTLAGNDPGGTGDDVPEADKPKASDAEPDSADDKSGSETADDFGLPADEDKSPAKPEPAPAKPTRVMPKSSGRPRKVT